MAAVASAPPGVAPLWCSDGAPTVPLALSWSGNAPTHVAGTPARNYFAVGHSGLYLRGKGLLNIEQAGTLSAVCIASVAAATAISPAAAAFSLTVASPFVESLKGCLHVVMTPTDGSSTAWPPLPTTTFVVDYYLRTSTPLGCLASTPRRSPDFTVADAVFNGTGIDAALTFASTCSAQCLVPPALVQPLAAPALDASAKNASLLEGFTPDGFVAVFLDGLVTSTRCVMSATPLSASPPFVLAYALVFGDAATGMADACGWFAQGPGSNLTYVMSSPLLMPVPLSSATASLCPTAWSDGGVNVTTTRTLVNYFRASASPSPSPVPPASAATTPVLLQTGGIVGIALGGTAVLIAAAFGVWCCAVRRCCCQKQYNKVAAQGSVN